MTQNVGVSPKCSLVYGEVEAEIWICCDHCSTWFDLEYAGLCDSELPDDFFAMTVQFEL